MLSFFFLTYFVAMLVGLRGGAWPEANAVCGAMSWKSLGTPGLEHSLLSRARKNRCFIFKTTT